MKNKNKTMRIKPSRKPMKKKRGRTFFKTLAVIIAIAGIGDLVLANEKQNDIEPTTIIAPIIIDVDNTDADDSEDREEVIEESPEGRVIRADVTAYSEFDSCHYANCAMASTKRAYVGAVACPRDMKLGTKVIIDGVTLTCEDRTNKNLDGRFDIFMGYGEESHTKALKFGIRNKEITILQ